MALPDYTLVFLMRGEIAATEVCMAMKKRGFGADRPNGAGGKVEAGETIEQGVRREAMEEFGVALGQLIPAGQFQGIFSHKPAWNRTIHVFLCREWQGEPTESEEMLPAWFKLSEVPYAKMWPGDDTWVPGVLAGKAVSGSITFAPNDVIAENRLVLNDPVSTSAN